MGTFGRRLAGRTIIGPRCPKCGSRERYRHRIDPEKPGACAPCARRTSLERKAAAAAKPIEAA